MFDISVNPVGSAGGEAPVGPQAHQDVHRKAVEPEKSPVPMNTFPGNTRLVYKVSQEDHEIVVMIVDEASSEVIRTVPNDAYKDIPSGGLIQKNA